MGTPEEQEELERIAAEERLRKEAEEPSIMKQKQEEWLERLEEVKKQEKELLEEQSIPLHNFLMKHVMPTLTNGLIECCKVRPDDPVDYLAEYLFQNNTDIE